jgi:hypothetical protein
VPIFRNLESENLVNQQHNRFATHAVAKKCVDIFLGLVCASLLLHGCDASAASLTRSVEVNAPPAAVWSVVGPFCAIRDWHPAIGSCAVDGGDPPTRTLVTKDGKTTFVEPQMAHSDRDRFYSYSFKSSPFPVTHYMGTIWVVPARGGWSTVLWTGTYAPLPGKDKEANDDFASVYEAGLAALKARFAIQQTK